MTSIDKESKEDITKLLFEQFENCPICCEHFEGKILQCKNSHLHCESCASKLVRHGVFGQCSSCREPVDGRNRQGEEIRAKFTVPCKNHGCNKNYKLGEAKQHLEICIHAPFDCAEPNYSGMGLCHEQLSPLELEFHLMTEHTTSRILPMRRGTWMFSSDYDTLKAGNSTAISLLDKDATAADLFLWLRLDHTSHANHPQLIVVPCSRWRDDKRRVRILMNMDNRGFELVHTMRVRPWDKRWSGLYEAPALVTNWAFDADRWVINFVVCTDPYLDEDFTVLNPALREAKDNPRKRKREESSPTGVDEFDIEDIEAGQQVDARDHKGKWYAAVVKEIKGRRVLVHFNAWSDDFDEWMTRSDENLAPLHTKTKQDRIASITPPSSPERQQLSQNV